MILNVVATAVVIVGTMTGLGEGRQASPPTCDPTNIITDPCQSADPSNGISGLLYIPGVPAVFDRQAGRTDGCGSCVWTSAVLCNSQSDDTTTCDTGGQRVCPIGDQYIEVSFADAQTPTEVAAHYCSDPADPPAIVTGGAVLAAASDADFVTAPDPLTSTDPDGTTLTQLPTYFATTPYTPRSLTRDLAAGGLTETIALDQPRWHWDFGDGTTLDTASPGGRYPDGDIRHTYTHTGHDTVTVTADYRRTIVVHTPFGDLPTITKATRAVTNPTRQVIAVREAHARLTDGD